jgi:hypothetical protein
VLAVEGDPELLVVTQRLFPGKSPDTTGSNSVSGVRGSR